MSNPFIEVVNKQRAFQHFHQCKNKLNDVGDELDIVYKENERLEKEREWLILKCIGSSDNVNAIWCGEDDQKKYLIEEMQQALKEG